jgi:hypothetical protein
MKPDQAKMLLIPEERAAAHITCTDRDILANPYLIYELTRLTSQPVSFPNVDRGAFPDAVIREKHPLPPPSTIGGGLDARRVRALWSKS